MRIKILTAVLVSLLIVSIVSAGRLIPANDKAKEKAKAPDNSPVIDEDWRLTVPYYVETDSVVLKGLLGVKHEFPGVFSTDLTQEQVEFLNGLGIKTERVQMYEITGKPGCTCNDNGVCESHLGEHPSCCDDCKGGGEEPPPPERTCYPDEQTPWGIVKVNGGSGGANVIVAVLDTGVCKDHLDLKANVVDCKDTTGKGIEEGCPDRNGHGTHVAGTILANGGADDKGIYGVAPGANLMAIKVCKNSGMCWGDDIAAGIRYAADNGANIISMSFGGDLPDPQVWAAIYYAVDEGVLLVAASGNDGPAEGSIDFPAAYAEVIAVGAINSATEVPNWSSRGINNGDWIVEDLEIEFAAPGVNVESTWKDGCYDTISGTSMATPHVSGLAAKLWDIADGTVDGVGNAADTRGYLQSIAEDIWEAGDDTATGFGLPVAP